MREGGKGRREREGAAGNEMTEGRDGGRGSAGQVLRPRGAGASKAPPVPGVGGGIRVSNAHPSLKCPPAEGEASRRTSARQKRGARDACVRACVRAAARPDLDAALGVAAVVDGQVPVVALLRSLRQRERKGGEGESASV